MALRIFMNNKKVPLVIEWTRSDPKKPSAMVVTHTDVGRGATLEFEDIPLTGDIATACEALGLKLVKKVKK